MVCNGEPVYCPRKSQLGLDYLDSYIVTCKLKQLYRNDRSYEITLVILYMLEKKERSHQSFLCSVSITLLDAVVPK